MTSESSLGIGALRKAFSQGVNISQLLVQQCPGLERQEVIEIAYDIQAGSYVQEALANQERLQQYAVEIYELVKGYVCPEDSILDCGAGELTTLSALSHHLPERARLLACDISLSRLLVGRRFAERAMDANVILDLFVADMAFMPLADQSVDIVFTSHALEPNHGREETLLKELLRVARRHLILFEPSWEHSSSAMRERMMHHGYVRDLPRHIQDAGGKLVAVKPLPHPMNPMNPTYCFVVEVASQGSLLKDSSDRVFQCPRSGFTLEKRANYWWSTEGAWAYPEIEGIPCLRTKHGVLMSNG
jgi:ubiquinone/menaquinone biosynthesis C-methylase UbiE